jgi:hypothetical protein
MHLVIASDVPDITTDFLSKFGCAFLERIKEAPEVSWIFFGLIKRKKKTYGKYTPYGHRFRPWILDRNRKIVNNPDIVSRSFSEMVLSSELGSPFLGSTNLHPISETTKNTNN